MSVVPPRRDELLTVGGLPTRRFMTWIESLTGLGNDNSNAIIEIPPVIFPPPAESIVQYFIESRLGSGDFLTSDETGFTVDLETLSVDMDES